MASDVYSRPPIIIRSHDLHACNIKGAVGEIASYHKKGTSSLLFLWFPWVVRLLAFLWPSLFVSSLMVWSIDLLWDFVFPL